MLGSWKSRGKGSARCPNHRAGIGVDQSPAHTLVCSSAQPSPLEITEHHYVQHPLVSSLLKATAKAPCGSRGRAQKRQHPWRQISPGCLCSGYTRGTLPVNRSDSVKRHGAPRRHTAPVSLTRTVFARCGIQTPSAPG